MDNELLINVTSTAPVRMVEIARSFSYKLNLGNYQSADFFMSQKMECREDEVEEASAKLYAFVKSQVLKAVAEAKKEKL